MAVSFPGGSGNYLKLDTTLATSGATVFVRYRVPTVPAASVFPIAVATRTGSTPYADGNQIHAFMVQPTGSTYEIRERAYWDSDKPAIVTGIEPGTWVSLAISMYEASTRPAVKFSVKPDGGTLATLVRNETWWTAANNVYTWINSTIWLGSNYGGATGAAGLAVDAIMYTSAITADADIEQQMDAIGAEFATPYWVTSLRGYATVAAAVAKESGTAVPTAWTVGGTLAIDNGFDGGGTAEVPRLSGGGVLDPTDSSTAPAMPAGFNVTTVTGTSVTLTWTPSAGAVWYYIYGRKVATQPGYELYQSTSSAPPLTLTNLEPCIQYGFVMVATNNAGDSPTTPEVLATTANLRLRLRATTNAAGKTGITVSVHYPPVAPAVVGAHIATFEDQAWEAATVVDSDLGVEVAEMFIETQAGTGEFGAGITEGDILEAYAEADDQTEASWMMKDVQVQAV